MLAVRKAKVSIVATGHKEKALNLILHTHLKAI
jgi:hypothetical protein